MNMTQKDFEFVASTIHHLISFWRKSGIGSDQIDADLISIFRSKLSETNPKFNSGRFEEACLDGLKSRSQDQIEMSIDDFLKMSVGELIKMSENRK